MRTLPAYMAADAAIRDNVSPAQMRVIEPLLNALASACAAADHDAGKTDALVAGLRDTLARMAAHARPPAPVVPLHVVQEPVPGTDQALPPASAEQPGTGTQPSAVEP